MSPFFFHSFFFLNSLTFSTHHSISGHTRVSHQLLFYVFLDTFIQLPVPLSSFLWQASREIVFFTVLMKAAQSCSLLSRLLFGRELAGFHLKVSIC